MRRISALLIFGALLASAGNASAAFYYVSNGTYFITGNVDPPAVHRATEFRRLQETSAT